MPFRSKSHSREPQQSDSIHRCRKADIHAFAVHELWSGGTKLTELRERKTDGHSPVLSVCAAFARSLSFACQRALKSRSMRSWFLLISTPLLYYLMNMQFKLLAFSALMFYLFSFFCSLLFCHRLHMGVSTCSVHIWFCHIHFAGCPLCHTTATIVIAIFICSPSVWRLFKPQIYSTVRVQCAVLVFTSFILTFAHFCHQRETERAEDRESERKKTIENLNMNDTTSKVCATLQVHFDYIHVNMGILLMIKYYIALWNFALYIGLSVVFLSRSFIRYFFFMIWTVFHVLLLSNESIYWTQSENFKWIAVETRKRAATAKADENVMNVIQFIKL